MHTRGQSTAIIVFLLVVGAIAATAHITQAQSSRRPATEADLKWLPWSGLPNQTIGTTIDPGNPYTGQAASEAKMWLAQHTKLNKSRIICLNPQFAQKLKAFMEQVPGGPPEITAAYRTIGEQQKAMQDGASKVRNACSGYHLYGLAVDFNNTAKQQLSWMRANARNAGIATIGDPVTGCFRSGFCDPGHFQDPGPQIGQCGICQTDGAGDTSTGGGTGDLGGTRGTGGNPLSSFANAIRQYLNPQPAPQQVAPIPSQPLQTSPLDSFSTTSTTVPTPLTPSGTSTADRLEELAFGPQPATTTASTSSVPLVVSGEDAVALSGSQNPTTAQVTPTQGISSPSQTTFTSGDLSWQGENVQTGPPLSGTAATLATLKSILTQILQYLKPFGGVQYLDGRLE